MKKRLLLIVFSILLANFYSAEAQLQSCGSQFIDNGGVASNYSDNSNLTYTICSDNMNEFITVTFTSFNIQPNYDAMYVYEGISANSPMIASSNSGANVPGGLDGGYWGNTPPGPFKATNPSGCLTFVFRSDSTSNESGWVANITCAPTPICAVPYSLSYSDLSNNSATISWNSPIVNSQHEVLVQPSTAAAPTSASSGVITSNNPYVLNGLTPGTSYNVYVRNICIGPNTSDWSNPLMLTTPICSIPTTIVTTSITQTSASFNWTGSPIGTYEILLSNTAISPGVNSVGTIVTSDSFQALGLNCGTSYYAFIRSICSNVLNSNWSTGYAFTTESCFQASNPVNLTGCVDGNATYCFDFSNNSGIVLNNLNPSEYTIAYYLSAADADNQTNPIVDSSAYCYLGTQTIYLRLTNTATQQYEVKTFTITASTVDTNVHSLPASTLCDSSGTGSVVYDLTTASAQINSSNSLIYFSNQNDAINQTNPIVNPNGYAVSVATPLVTIYIREIVVGQCDNLYTLALQTTSGCNLAYNCNQANSLCNSLGIPFANTNQGIPGTPIACLANVTNPTWFYLPVSNNGTINLTVEQSSDITFTNPNAVLDVDYVVYGPFYDLVTPCTSPMTINEVNNCGSSASAVEHPVIQNAVAGQYYLLMTTNFSNQAGFIRITMDTSTTAAIDCSGLRLNAFLDSNNNGSQDIGEQNFPMGEFHYNINNGAVNNITSPVGSCSIYDTNHTNSYNLNFSIDPLYSSMYGTSIPSYSTINVTGTGMTTYNFPITIIQNYTDVAVSIVPITSPRSGWTYTNQIVYTNLGSQTIPSGTITVTVDPALTIEAISQLGTNTTPTGFTYDYTNLLPFESRTITFDMPTPVPPTISLGQLLTNSVSITPTANDVILSNNSSVSSQAVVFSYDPNDKTESHGDKIMIGDFTANDYLYYTIRFENTGSVSAIDIFLNDLLDSKLDETTVKMVAASHNYTLDRVNNNLTWKFDNIQLPVSIANTQIGKGYVTFGVKPKSGYSVGDIIPNTAYIYFDYNPAVITNTFTTEFVSALSTSSFETNGFILYPNPATNSITISLINPTDTINAVTIYDVLGHNIKEVRNLSTMETSLDVSTLARGVYMV